MIVSTQQLRTMFDELSRRIDALEFEVSFLKKGEKVPPPAKQPDPEPEQTKPSGGIRHWSADAGQFDSFTSHRWKSR